MSEVSVLIIEDNVQNMYLERYLVEHSGYKVIEARDGFDGIKKATKFLPDLILLDIQLPLMDGYEVARQLKENENTCNIPIVVVTSYAMPIDKKKVFSLGCNGYIEKPIDSKLFISQIQQFILKNNQDHD